MSNSTMQTESNTNQNVPTFKKTLSIIGSIIMLAVLIPSLIYSLNPDNNIIGIKSMRKAFEYSQEVMREEVSSANVKFPKFDAEFIDRAGQIEYDGEIYTMYTVTAHMEWENIFGTMMREKYIVKIGLPQNDNQDNYYYEIISFLDDI